MAIILVLLFAVFIFGNIAMATGMASEHGFAVFIAVLADIILIVYGLIKLFAYIDEKIKTKDKHIISVWNAELKKELNAQIDKNFKIQKWINQCNLSNKSVSHLVELVFECSKDNDLKTVYEGVEEKIFESHLKKLNIVLDSENAPKSKKEFDLYAKQQLEKAEKSQSLLHSLDKEKYDSKQLLKIIKDVNGTQYSKIEKNKSQKIRKKVLIGVAFGILLTGIISVCIFFSPDTAIAKAKSEFLKDENFIKGISQSGLTDLSIKSYTFEENSPRNKKIEIDFDCILRSKEINKYSNVAENSIEAKELLKTMQYLYHAIEDYRYEYSHLNGWTVRFDDSMYELTIYDYDNNLYAYNDLSSHEYLKINGKYVIDREKN